MDFSDLTNFMPSPPDLDGEPKVNNSTNAGNNSALEQDSTIPKGWKPTVDKPLPVVRCTGTVRNGPREGERCGRWSIMGHDKCLVHGAQLPNVKEAAGKKIDAARMRLIADADLAVDTLFELIQPGTADQVRLGASKEILDRAGVRGGLEISVEHSTASAVEEINKRLNVMRERIETEEDIVDAEEVDTVESEDGEETADREDRDED